jgi:hypothetical protein
MKFVVAFLFIIIVGVLLTSIFELFTGINKISHDVSQRMRARYQMQTAKIFEL